MTESEILFHKIADAIPDSKKSRMFGALCVKTPNGKAGIMFWKDSMIFKLPEIIINDPLSLPESKIFEPMPGRPMNGWCQIPYDSKSKWKEYTQIASEYVRHLPAKEKKSKKQNNYYSYIL